MIVVVCGVTASGKSKIAQNIAALLNCDILNGDAFQVYKELNIGVNKPDSETIQKFRYHLIDFLPADTAFSIANYQKMARKIINDKLSLNEHLVIEGGSGLYLRSLLFDYEFAEKNDEFLDDYDSMNNDELFSILAKRDPESAATIHINNRKRVIRALRIFDETGITKSQAIKMQQHNLIFPNVHFVALEVARKELYAKINDRVNIMWQRGLKNEVIELLKIFPPDLQSLQAIGYKETIQGILSDQSDDEIIALIQKNTRNYAKRQITYFKHQLPVFFFNAEDDITKYIRSSINGPF